MTFIEDPKKGVNSFVLRLAATAAVILHCSQLCISAPNPWLLHTDWFALTIFAYLLADGHRHSSDNFLYAVRLLLFGLLAEIPYNYLMSGFFIHTGYQNVMFSLFLGLAILNILDWAKKKFDNSALNVILIAVLGTIGFQISVFLNFQLGGFGLLLILIFHASEKMTYPRLFQFIALMTVLYSTDAETFSFFGHTPVLPEGILIFPAMLLIWRHNGKREQNTIAQRYAYYASYPVILAVFALIRML